MRIVDLKAFSEDETIEIAVDALRQGLLVIYPTETLYGIAADATNPEAVSALLAYKKQRDNKPISIAVDSIAMAEKYVDINEQAKSLYATLLPGPYTIVSRSRHKVDPRCETMHGTLGIRIPDYPLVRQMISRLGKPVTATSANPSYKRQPRSLADITEVLDDVQKGLVTIVIDAGTLPKRDPSTILDTTVGEVKVLRQGVEKYRSEERHLSTSVDKTIALGADLMSRYKHYVGYKSIVFALRGEMGAGKTHFTKGIAASLQIEQDLKSPTFVLSQEYAIPQVPNSHAAVVGNKFYHVDLWRVRDEEEILGLGLLELIENGHIFAMEWADKALKLLQEIQHDAVIVWVDFEYLDGVDEREIVYHFR